MEVDLGGAWPAFDPRNNTRFYLTSRVMVAARLGSVGRSYWAIENSLHRVMDRIFRDDECRVRTDHAPANFTTMPPRESFTRFARRKPAIPVAARFETRYRRRLSEQR